MRRKTSEGGPTNQDTARQRPYRRRATMTGREFQTLRKQMGLEVRQLAHLLACTETTIRNIEARGDQRPSRTMERLMQGLCSPTVRLIFQQIADQEK